MSRFLKWVGQYIWRLPRCRFVLMLISSVGAGVGLGWVGTLASPASSPMPTNRAIKNTAGDASVPTHPNPTPAPTEFPRQFTKDYSSFAALFITAFVYHENTMPTLPAR